MKTILGLMFCAICAAKHLEVITTETPCQIQFVDPATINAALIWDDQLKQITFFDYKTNRMGIIYLTPVRELCTIEA